MDRLRQLDVGVTSKATSKALTVGIVGVLVMGSGMSLVMTGIGGMIGLNVTSSLIIGIIIGVIGMIIAAFPYPLDISFHCVIIQSNI